MRSQRSSAPPSRNPPAAIYSARYAALAIQPLFWSIRNETSIGYRAQYRGSIAGAPLGHRDPFILFDNRRHYDCRRGADEFNGHQEHCGGEFRAEGPLAGSIGCAAVQTGAIWIVTQFDRRLYGPAAMHGAGSNSAV